MLNDFLPIIKKLKEKDFPNGITIVPLSDAHYGSEQFDEVMWHRATKRIYDDPKCFAVCVGDLLDTGTKTSLTSPYSQTCSPRAQKEWLINELRCLAESGKILAITDGNHEKRVSRESDNYPIYDVALALGIEDVYRPNICFLEVRFIRPDGKHREHFALAITHGAGGGQYIGSSANKSERYALCLEGVDCLISGHTHKPLTFPASKLVFDGNAKTVKQRQFTVVVASSFLDYGGYPVEKMLSPTARTITEIQLNYSAYRGKEIRVLQ